MKTMDLILLGVSLIQTLGLLYASLRMRALRGHVRFYKESLKSAEKHEAYLIKDNERESREFHIIQNAQMAENRKLRRRVSELGRALNSHIKPKLPL